MTHGNEYNNDNEDNERGFFKNEDGTLKTGHVLEAGLAGAGATAFGVHEYRKHERKEGEYPQQGQQQQESFFRNEDGTVRKAHAIEAGLAGVAATAFGAHEYNKHQHKEEEQRMHDQYNQNPPQGQQQHESFFRNEDGSVNRAHAAETALGAAAAIGAAVFGVHEYRKHQQEEQEEEREGEKQN
ncbi:hypothetical protein LPJ59_002832 [Coemansia sp. RSA 2399]|nr:hypothetical protein LPJ59_002832 [Coemansia sp. RSA 2399]KAJ1904452.1 hypothetical protein LPJ81_002488 [Coemansia sp. IMI 209127]